MKQLLFVLATLIAFCASSLAQDSARDSTKYQAEFQKGIDALLAERHDDGIAAFKACLELRTEDPTCAYNIACGYSLKSEIEPAFEWLGKAADWGFGNSESSLELAATKDTDLANLRSDPRFEPLIERMRKAAAVAKAAAEKEWKNPIVILPEGHEAMETVGALVVLHDVGQTKARVAESAWKELAKARGLALVVPSGKIVAAREPAEGMAWFTDFEEFTRRYWVAEESIKPAFAALEKQVKAIDPARTIIVGEGQGALVAFNAAMRAPRQYAGVLTVDGPIMTTMTQSYIPNAVSAGVRVRCVVDSEGIFGVPKEQVAGFSGQMRSSLRMAKLDGEVLTYTLDEKRPTLRGDLVAEQLAKLLPSDTAAAKGDPVEPGSGTDK